MSKNVKQSEQAIEKTGNGNGGLAKADQIKAEMLNPLKKAGDLNADSLIARGFKTTIFAKLEQGDVLEGTYLGAGAKFLLDDPAGAKEVVTINGEKIERVKQNEVTPHFFLMPSRAVTVRINGSSALDRELANVKRGQLVVVIAKGKEKTRKGLNFNAYAVMPGPMDADFIDDANPLPATEERGEVAQA